MEPSESPPSRAWIAATCVLGFLFIYKVLEGYSADDPAGDFANYWLAARLTLSGAFTDPGLYQASAFTEAMAAVAPPQLAMWVPQPPTTMLPALPLGLLPLGAAKAVFTILNLGLMAALWQLLTRLTGLGGWAAAAILLGAGRGLWNQLIQGQLYLLLLVSILGGLALAGRGRSLGGGLALGLMLPVKLVSAPIAAYQLIRGRWAFALGAALGTGIAGGAAVLLTGPAMMETWFREILPWHLAGRLQDPFAAVFQSTDVLLRRLLVAEPSLNPTPAIADLPALASWLGAAFDRGVWILAGLGIAGRLAGGPARRAPSDSEEALWAAGVLLTAGLVAAPATATYHFLLLIPAVAAVLGPRSPAGALQRGAVAGLYLAIALLPVSPFLRFDGQGWWTLAAHPRLYLSAAFLVALVGADARAAAAWVGCGTRRLAAAAVLVAAALAPTSSPPPPPADGASWAGAPGLLLDRPAFIGGGLSWLEAGPTGFSRRQAGGEAGGSPGAAIAGASGGAAPAGEGGDAGGAPRIVSLDGRFRLVALGSLPSTFVVEEVSTGARWPVVDPSSHSWAPTFSPDDAHIYFASDRGRGVLCGTLYRIPFSPPEAR